VDDSIAREEGRSVFGRCADTYHAIRPDYPDWVYRILLDRCGLSGARVLEVGAGSGLATRRLLQLGAGSLVAVEPDPGFRPVLEQLATASAGRMTILASTFEAATLPMAAFDLGVCATALHWLEPSLGPRKFGACLRPGGWLAVFWNVFHDPDRVDPLHEATLELLEDLARSPSHEAPERVPYALDEPARRADFHVAGAEEEFAVERVAWTLRRTAREIRALYSTWASIARLPDDAREAVLDGVERVAEREFGGIVERPMITVLYTGRRTNSPR